GGSLTGGMATNLIGYVSLNSGAFNINGTVTSTNVQLAGGTLTGNNVFNGGFNWIVGDWSGAASETIAANSIFLIPSINDHNMASTLVTNNGTVAWSDGRIRGGGTSVYNNGLWDAQNDQTFNNDFGGGTTFNNFGTFVKSGGTNTSSTQILGGVFFNNLGKLDSQVGVISLQSGFNLTNGTLNF